GEKDERLEADALGERPGDEGWCDDGEHHLEDHVGLVRDGRSVIDVGLEAHALQPYPAQAPDEAVAEGIWREGQRVAPEYPLDADQPDDDEALHDGGQRVFAPDQAAVEKRQARRHQEDESTGSQEPRRVACVYCGWR